jgi:hypothetical protein
VELDVPTIDDPRIMVAIDLPKFGLALRLPRFDFMPEKLLDELTTKLSAIDEDGGLNDRKKLRAARLATFKAVVSAKDYKVLETFTVGQLEKIYEAWVDQSNIPLAKFLASAPFSTENSEAPSPMTSSSADTVEATSDAA